MTIMNATYTYTAHYPTFISSNGAVGASKDLTRIQLMEAATHRVQGARSIQLWTSMPLLCPSPENGVIQYSTPQDFGIFPISWPTYAVYRPLDVCNWDISKPGAAGLRINANAFWVASKSLLAFTATREQDVRWIDDSDKVLMSNTGSGRGVSLQVNGDTASVWFYANGQAGYSFYLEYQRTASKIGFSWSIAVSIFMTSLPA
jgi:hypothetical protein